MRVIGHPVVRRYVVAAGLARVADEMIQPSVVLLALSRDTGHGAVLAGLLVGAFTLPTVCSGPVLGAWLDGTRYRRLVLGGGQLVIACCALGLAGVVGRTPMWVAVIVAGVGGLALPTTSGGFSALVPRLVDAVPEPPFAVAGCTRAAAASRRPRENDVLARANALDALTFNAGAIAGPAVAATVSALAGADVALVLVTVLATASAAATRRLPALARKSVAGDAADDAAGTGLGRRIGQGLRLVAGAPPLLGATVTSLLGFGSVGALTVVFPLYARELGGRTAWGGYFLTALEVGALVSTVTVAGRLGRWRPERVVFCGTAGYGVLMLCWPLAGSVAGHGFPLAVGLVAVAGLVEGPVLPALFAVRQRYAPPGLHGQVATTAASLKIGAFAVGGVVGGRLAGPLPPDVLITAVALTQLVAAAVGATTAAWNRRDAVRPRPTG